MIGEKLRKKETEATSQYLKYYSQRNGLESKAHRTRLRARRLHTTLLIRAVCCANQLSVRILYRDIVDRIALGALPPVCTIVRALIELFIVRIYELSTVY